MPRSKAFSMANSCWTLVGPALCLSDPSIASANEVSDLIQKEIKRNFAASVLLNDTDVFTFGINNFDPNEVFRLDNEDIGSSDSVSRRQNMASLSLPYTFKLPATIEDNHQEVTLRLSALRTENEVDYSSTSVTDFQKETVISGYVEFSNVIQLDGYWSFHPGIGNHISYYRNDYEYRGNVPGPNIVDQLEGVYLNTDA